MNIFLKVKKVIRFTVKHLFLNTKFFLAYAYLLFQKDGSMKVNVMSDEDLAHKIKTGKSLIRIGDGEIYMINYGSIHYEKYSNRIRDYFLKIIKGYNSNSNYILSVVDWGIMSTNQKLKESNTFSCWLPYKAQWLINFNKKVSYFGAGNFYKRMFFDEYVLPHIQNKNIILISREDNCEHIKNIKYFKKIDFVITPDLNSFEKFDEIKSEISSKLNQLFGEGVIKNDVALLVACGPASKPICYDFSNQGVQSLDIGRGVELIGTGEGLEHMLV